MLTTRVALRSSSTCTAAQVRGYSKVAKPVAIAFDIDGVLKQGENILPEARRSLSMLQGNNKWNRPVPYIFLTNSGGQTEEGRAQRLSNDLGVPVTPQQVVLSHTVMQSLVATLGNRPVLMLGGPETPDGSTRTVLEGYGFNQVYTVHDLHAYAPAVWPYEETTAAKGAAVKLADFSKVHFAAVIVFHDSRQWGRDIQFAIDILRSRDGVFGTVLTNSELKQRPPIPIYFAHGDLCASFTDSMGKRVQHSALGTGCFPYSFGGGIQAHYG